MSGHHPFEQILAPYFRSPVRLAAQKIDRELEDFFELVGRSQDLLAVLGEVLAFFEKELDVLLIGQMMRIPSGDVAPFNVPGTQAYRAEAHVEVDRLVFVAIRLKIAGGRHKKGFDLTADDHLSGRRAIDRVVDDAIDAQQQVFVLPELLLLVPGFEFGRGNEGTIRVHAAPPFRREVLPADDVFLAALLSFEHLVEAMIPVGEPKHETEKIGVVESAPVGRFLRPGAEGCQSFVHVELGQEFVSLEPVPEIGIAAEGAPAA